MASKALSLVNGTPLLSAPGIALGHGRQAPDQVAGGREHEVDFDARVPTGAQTEAILPPPAIDRCRPFLVATEWVAVAFWRNRDEPCPRRFRGEGVEPDLVALPVGLRF